MQISEESTGLPPTDEISIKLETEWIYNQLVTGIAPLFSKSDATTEAVDDELKRHIARFLELMHVQKLDVCVFHLTLTFILTMCCSPSYLLNCSSML